MKLTVIGYDGGSVRAGGACSSYLLEWKGHKILLDCGPGSLSKLLTRYDFNEIHDVIISHYHYDHFSDIGAMVHHRLIQTQIGAVAQPFSIYCQDAPYLIQSFDMGATTEIQQIDESSVLDLHGLKVDFMVTQHPVKCLAMRMDDGVRRLVYTADSALSEELVEFSTGADLLVLECSLYPGYDGGPAGHMNPEDASDLIKRSQAKQAVLTHLPIYGNPAEILAAVEDQVSVSVALASDFLEIEII